MLPSFDEQVNEKGPPYHKIKEQFAHCKNTQEALDPNDDELS